MGQSVSNVGRRRGSWSACGPHTDYQVVKWKLRRSKEKERKGKKEGNNDVDAFSVPSCFVLSYCVIFRYFCGSLSSLSFRQYLFSVSLLWLASLSLSFLVSLSLLQMSSLSVLFYISTCSMSLYLFISLSLPLRCHLSISVSVGLFRSRSAPRFARLLAAQRGSLSLSLPSPCLCPCSTQPNPCYHRRWLFSNGYR